MRVAHLAVITPKRCGLYETTREVVASLRARGIDSRLVDPKRDANPLHPTTPEDRGAPIADLAWAMTADVLVNHSGLGKELEATAQPVVHVAHGRPRSSFLSEATGGTPIYSYHYAVNKAPRYKAVVTFWPQHVPYLSVMFPDKPIHALQAPVDLQAWTPRGPEGYGFHGKRGRINVVCTDAWRDDIDPFVPVNAFALWAREMQGARLHVYGSPKQPRGWGALFRRLQDDGTLGEVCGWVDGLAHVYRAADLMLTAHEIDTRSVREAMACGCPVVRLAPHLNGFRADIARARDTDRATVRREAERRFDPAVTAAQFAAILEASA